MLLIPWLKCKIFGHKWRIITIQDNCYSDPIEEEYIEWETEIYYNCLNCKKKKYDTIVAKMQDKEKINLIESYEDN